MSKQMKTICVLTQTEVSHYIGASIDDTYHTLLEAYSSYDKAIQYMDDEVLSFVNEMIFRGSKLNFYVDLDYTGRIRGIDFYYGDAVSQMDFKTMFTLECIDLVE